MFDPGVPVTLDLDVHLRHRPDGVRAIRMEGRVAKAGRSPNSSLRMPTIVRDDEGLLRPHPPSLEVPFAERAGCERTAPGVARIPMRPDGLNASGTLNGGLLALVVEEAALSAGGATGLASLSMRYAQPVRVGPAVATAEVVEGLGRTTVTDAGRGDRFAVLATTRAFPA